MKIVIKDKIISFIPEHDKDCFDLGCLSERLEKLDHKLKFQLEIISKKSKPLPKIVKMEISIAILWEFIMLK